MYSSYAKRIGYNGAGKYGLCFNGFVEQSKTGEYQMNLEKLSSRVSEELDTVIPANLSAGERKAIRDIVRQGLMDASKRTHREMKETAVICCGPEADLAHKTQERMDEKRKVLITNLMAMR